MPAKSKAQARFMGAVLRCKTEGKCPSKEIREAAQSMTKKEIEDYMKQPEGIPEKKAHLEALIQLANDLDSAGLRKEADILDALIKAL
jgi:hypothetical protein